MIAFALVSSGPEVPDSSVLTIELAGPLAELPPMDPIERFFSQGVALPTLILQLDKAAADPRIQAVLFHIRPLQGGFAQVQELRQGIERVRAAGKPVICLLDLATLNATRELYLAAAADEIYLVPAFLGPMAGIAGQFMHLGGLLDKVGIAVEYERVGEYKSAVETFAGYGMSEPARENANALLDGLYAQLVDGIARGRKLEPDVVRELVEQAPSTGAEYISAGLADGIADRDSVLEKAGLADAEEVALSTYVHVDPTDLELRNGPTVALIFAQGTIVSGGGRGSRSFSSGRVADALEAASEDEDVQAIVLRIDSGGGSALASDELWRVIRRTAEDTPVVISMGNAAASGGYYLASAADAIVAEPATLTGSIGVFLIRASFGGLYEKLGVDAEVIVRGDYAAINANANRLTEAQRVRTRSIVRSAYDDFLDRVAEGRDMTREDVDRLGRGQVFLGQAAFEHGLVDAVGGLHTAVELAKEKAGIDPDIDVERRVYPGPRGLREQLREALSGSLRDRLIDALLPRELPPMLDAATSLLDGELALLPPYWIEIR